MEQVPDVNAIRTSSDPHRREPLLLHVACASFNSGSWKDNVEGKRKEAERIIDLLLCNGANPHVILDNGSPLVAAVIEGGGTLKTLLDSTCGPGCSQSARNDPFFDRQTKETSIKLIEAGADVL